MSYWMLLGLKFPCRLLLCTCYDVLSIVKLPLFVYYRPFVYLNLLKSIMFNRFTSVIPPTVQIYYMNPVRGDFSLLKLE